MKGKLNTKTIEPTACPFCEWIMEDIASMQITDRTRETGDIALCMNCGGISVFDSELLLQPITQNHLDRYQREAPFQFMHMTMAQMAIRQRGPIPEELRKKHEAKLQKDDQ